MRQTYDKMFRYKKLILKTTLFLFIFFCAASNLMADIFDPTLTVTSQGATGKINALGEVTLNATWSGDTPPFSATFKVKDGGSITLGSETTSGSTSSFMVSGSELGHGTKSFEVVIIESSVANAVSKTAQGDASVEVDLIKPVVDVQIFGSEFSNNPGNNEVRIRVTSSKTILTPNVSVAPNTLNASIQAASTNPNEGMVFDYTIELATAEAGNYTFTAVGKDLTLPAAGANEGTGTEVFRVNVAGPGAPTISDVDPPSPTNYRNIELKGSAPSNVDPSKGIRIYSSGAQVGTGVVSGTTWTATLSGLAEGEHNFTARCYDSLGNLSAESSPYRVVIDLTPPGTPQLDTSGITTPTNLSRVTITGTAALESGTVVSAPVTVRIFNQSNVEVGNTRAANDGTFTIVNVPLEVGVNNFYAIAEDSTNPNPNLSGPSNRITIERDDVPSGITSFMISRTADGMPPYHLPIPAAYLLGAGTYDALIRFEKNMNQSVIPDIEVRTEGGSTIKFVDRAWNSGVELKAKFTIPTNGGASYDGEAIVAVSGASDAAGNPMDEVIYDPALSVDCTPPVTTFSDNSIIYVSETTTNIALSGTVEDRPSTGASGISSIKIVWQSFSDPSNVGESTVPFLLTSPSPWTFNWDPSSLSEGKYKLWALSSDKAQPLPNEEDSLGKEFRTVVVDLELPTVLRISLDDLTVDIKDMQEEEVPVIASEVVKLTAVIADTGGSEIAFNSPDFVFSLEHDETGTKILGNYFNNGIDTIAFNFPNLANNGTYTVTVTPVDVSGNFGETETRQFVIDRVAPNTVEFNPPNQSIANDSQEALKESEVWATINHHRPDYERSTIEVTYNGILVGNQVIDPDKLVAKLHGARGLAVDQTHDGRYDVTVVPVDLLGNKGAPVRGYFFYDTVPPVITEFEPAKDSVSGEEVWFGLNQNSLKLTLSDAPKDILANADKMRGLTFGEDKTYAGLGMPGDVSWANGSGSGVNMSVSSFTYTFEDQEPPTASIQGNTLSLPRPQIPQLSPGEGMESTPGAGEVKVEFVLSDNVTEGDSVPNIVEGEYSYWFDYAKPEIKEISSPSPTNNKYCKNVLTVQGLAEDVGTLEELRIVAIEWAWPGNSWTEVNAAGLPAKAAAFEFNVDISSLVDGNHSLLMRARDKGGNYSDERTISFQVKRTPPPPPELVIPLPDVVTNKRGQQFKWNPSNGAEMYLLQIADDGSFGNVVNAQTDNDYAGLVGQVFVMSEGAFSLPKDGAFYWRVAAIEKCVDGYNISNFSSSRKIVVDTVKPKVVSVSPSPSSSNKITTGMVTFTIRFSELIDMTVPLRVRLTSSGGEVMAIEKVSASEDTWIGTTVLPKNESALYDGVAVISIEAASDLAGNIMETDSTNTVVVNTGPAFQIRIFSNPINPFEILILTRASESLQGPPTCSVQQSSAKTSVSMNFLKDRYYSGAYKIDVDSPGKAYINISATDLHGMTGYGSVEFTVADISASKRLNIVANNGMAELKGAVDSVFSDSSIYMIERENLESPFATDIRANAISGIAGIEQAYPKNGSELAGVVPLEYVGPVDLTLKKRLLYTADVKGHNIDFPEDRLHIYRLNSSGEWVFQGGNYAKGEISAELTGLGRMALMADIVAPVLKDMSISNNERLEDAIPEIKGLVLDYGSGFNRDSFKMYLNDQLVPSLKLEKDGSFEYKVKQPLIKGKHEITIEAKDMAGNLMRESFVVTAPGAFAIDEFTPYPNPAKTDRMLFNYNFNQRAESVSLKIYDTAGHLVTKFETADFANQTEGRIRWNLTNGKGKRVANGAYFYRLQVTRNGQTIHKRGSLAVMR